jgi:hypothetical protein
MRSRTSGSIGGGRGVRPFARPLLPDELPVPAEQGLGPVTNEDHRPLEGSEERALSQLHPFPRSAPGSWV